MIIIISVLQWLQYSTSQGLVIESYSSPLSFRAPSLVVGNPTGGGNISLHEGDWCGTRHQFLSLECHRNTPHSIAHICCPIARNFRIEKNRLMAHGKELRKYGCAANIAIKLTLHGEVWRSDPLNRFWIALLRLLHTPCWLSTVFFNILLVVHLVTNSC